MPGAGLIGVLLKDCAETIWKHTMDTMSNMMGYSAKDEGRNELLGLLTPADVQLFYIMYKNERELGTATRGYT